MSLRASWRLLRSIVALLRMVFASFASCSAMSRAHPAATSSVLACAISMYSAVVLGVPSALATISFILSAALTCLMRFSSVVMMFLGSMCVVLLVVRRGVRGVSPPLFIVQRYGFLVYLPNFAR